MQLTRALLSELYDDLFHAPLPHRFLFGVRGAVPAAPGSLRLQPKDGNLDVCDDAVGYMVGDAGKAYLGSVDPGRYWTAHPMRTEGCARMIEGHYTFVKGPHKTEPRAWRGLHVACWRDRNRNGRIDSSERRVYVVASSINLHYGGQGNTVGEYSAGCQIVRRGRNGQPGWEQFRDETYQQFDHQATYWLINSNALQSFQVEKKTPVVVLNDQSMPRPIPLWISQENRVVAVARAFLESLQQEGQPPAFTFVPGNPPVLEIAGRQVAGNLVHDRLVCPVSDLIRALDPEARIAWESAGKRMEVQSARLQVAAPAAVPIERLTEAEDPTEIPPEPD